MLLDTEQAEESYCSECSEQEDALRLCHGCKSEVCSRCSVLVEDDAAIKQPYCKDCRPTEWSRLPWVVRRQLLTNSVQTMLEGRPHEVVREGDYDVWRWEGGEVRLKVPQPDAKFCQGEGSL